MRQQLKQRHLSSRGLEMSAVLANKMVCGSLPRIRLRPTSMHGSTSHSRAANTHIARRSTQDLPRQRTEERSPPTPHVDVGEAEAPCPWLLVCFRLCRGRRRRRRGQLLVLLLIQTGVVVVVVVVVVY